MNSSVDFYLSVFVIIAVTWFKPRVRVRCTCVDRPIIILLELDYSIFSKVPVLEWKNVTFFFFWKRYRVWTKLLLMSGKRFRSLAPLFLNLIFYLMAKLLKSISAWFGIFNVFNCSVHLCMREKLEKNYWELQKMNTDYLKFLMCKIYRVKFSSM